MYQPFSRRLWAAGGVLTALAAIQPLSALAGSIDPASVIETLSIGEILNVKSTVKTDAGDKPIVNILFLADNTGSMGGVIGNVRSVANSLLTELSSAYPGAKFGVARYFGDPSEFGESFTSAYKVLQPMTTNQSDVITGFNGWVASGGGDTPEAGFYSLQQAVTNGTSTCPGLGSNPGFCGGSGSSVGWDMTSKKVILQFGDATSHQNTVTMNNAIAALNAADAAYVALNSTSGGFGLDGNFPDGGQPGNQASTVAAAIPSGGGKLINNFASVPISNIVSTIEDAIGDVTAKLNLSLVVDGVLPLSGVNVSFSCIDPLGCMGVTPGESRDFNMQISGDTLGFYPFEVVSPGVPGARQNVEITIAGKGSDCGTYPIASIIDDPTGFSCTIGDKTFSEFNGLGDLADGTLTFSASGDVYQLLFDGFDLTRDVSFNYAVRVNDLSKEIMALNQVLGGSASPSLNELISTEGLPTQNTTLVSNLAFTGNVTSITHTITQTPGPLPIMGAGMAFGFSRKLRRRIKLSA